MNDDKKPIPYANIYKADIGTSYAGWIWETNGLCPALNTMQGGNRTPLVKVIINDKDSKSLEWDW